MARAYYVIESGTHDSGYEKSDTLDIPAWVPDNEIVHWVYGVLFQNYWTFDTPHAIYVNDGSGYRFEAGDEEINEIVFDTISRAS
jgi:hypothetical protein